MIMPSQTKNYSVKTIYYVVTKFYIAALHTKQAQAAQNSIDKLTTPDSDCGLFPVLFSLICQHYSLICQKISLFFGAGNFMATI